MRPTISRASAYTSTVVAAKNRPNSGTSPDQLMPTTFQAIATVVIRYRHGR